MYKHILHSNFGRNRPSRPQKCRMLAELSTSLQAKLLKHQEYKTNSYSRYPHSGPLRLSTSNGQIHIYVGSSKSLLPTTPSLSSIIDKAKGHRATVVKTKSAGPPHSAGAQRCLSVTCYMRLILLAIPILLSHS